MRHAQKAKHGCGYTRESSNKVKPVLAKPRVSVGPDHWPDGGKGPFCVTVLHQKACRICLSHPACQPSICLISAGLPPSKQAAAAAQPPAFNKVSLYLHLYLMLVVANGNMPQFFSFSSGVKEASDSKLRAGYKRKPGRLTGDNPADRRLATWSLGVRAAKLAAA